MVVDQPARVASRLLNVLTGDLGTLEVFEGYWHGKHRGPYIPENADAEYRLLAERCITNWMPLLVRTPAQAMYVDGFRYRARGSEDREDITDNPAWSHWQRSGLDGRQSSLYESAFAMGHAFTVTERSTRKRDKGKSITRLLSPMSTAALFADPVNDLSPAVAFNIRRWPTRGDGDEWELGEADMWDDQMKYLVEFDLASDDKRKLRVNPVGKHGATECPVTRFAASIDLEGRTIGVIEPMIPIQDRINQSIFDLLIVQTNGSFEVRWATGMAPPLKKRTIYLTDHNGDTVFDEQTGRPVVEAIVDDLDEQGRPIPEDINISPKRFLMAEDPDAKFGSMPGTPLDGYINSIDMAIRHLAMVSQTPPTHMMGSIVNLSAEAMASAEVALTRKVEAYKTDFGEAWERVALLAAEIDGEPPAEDDIMLETAWRDMEGQSFAKSADALLKIKELEVPVEGLWSRIPGVTATEIENWLAIRESSPENVLASHMAGSKPVRGQAANSTPETMANADPDLE